MCRGRPTTLFCRYYHKYGRQYVAELAAHADRVLAALRALPATAAEEGSAELDELESEYDVATDMRNCLMLMVVMYLPEDGEGRAIVAENVLAWVNESNPSARP